MKPWRALLGLAVLFAGVVAARWPANSLASRLPAPFVCNAAGTIWNGRCEPLSASGKALGSLEWQLRFWPLLTGKVDLHVDLRAPDLSVQTDLQPIDSRGVELRDLQARISLTQAAPKLTTVGLRGLEGLGGDLTATASRVGIGANGRIGFLQGEVQVDRLAQAREPRQLGSWSLIFDGRQSANGEPVGQLTDRGGPLQFQGTLKLTAAPGYLLEGVLQPRGAVPPEALAALRMLGPEDASGRRTIGIEGQF